MTTIDLSKLQDITLRRGSHSTRTAGVCAMEAVAWLAGEHHCDRPQCACPVVSAFVRTFNDSLPGDDIRTHLLLPLVPRLVGSKSTRAIEHRRACLAVDWALRVATPLALETAYSGVKSATYAARLRALPEVVDTATAEVAGLIASNAGDYAPSRTAYAAAHAAGYLRGGIDYPHAATHAADAFSLTHSAVKRAGADELCARLRTDAVALIERMLDVRAEPSQENP